jgi:hypothetical protein
VLDELPSLEFAATAVALVLGLRALVLWRKVGLVRGKTRVESARARDLIGLAILVGALVYAVRMERATTWFLVAVGIAVVALLLGFYWRAAVGAATKPGDSARSDAAAEPEIDFEDEELLGCASCGHGTLIELDESSPLLAGLSALTPVFASVCPSCGALAGQVEDPAKIPIDAAHGTTRREGPSTSDHEALEEPTEHDG